MRQLNKRDFCLIGMIALLSAAGCSKKDQPVTNVNPPNQNPQVVKQVAKPVQNAVSSVKKLDAPPSNQFEFSNKKDPFKPDIAIKSVSPKASENKINLSALPIHSFDVSQFRLIGIITGSKENQAMVVDPNGKGYVLKPGMTIGKNEGKITSIAAGGVDILEQFRDDNGKLRKENIRLTLPKKQ